MNFHEKLNRAITRNQSLTIVGLDPNPEIMPSIKYTSDNSQFFRIDAEELSSANQAVKMLINIEHPSATFGKIVHEIALINSNDDFLSPLV